MTEAQKRQCWKEAAQALTEALRDDNACLSQKTLHLAADLLEKSFTEERNIGTWKTAYLDHEACGVRPMVLYCSECHQVAVNPTKFCPNCGADMT